MMLESERKTIKSVRKWYYRLELLQDKKGIYHIVTTLPNKRTSAAFIDYSMASSIFDLKFNSFEGN